MQICLSPRPRRALASFPGTLHRVGLLSTLALVLLPVALTASVGSHDPIQPDEVQALRNDYLNELASLESLRQALERLEQQHGDRLSARVSKRTEARAMAARDGRFRQPPPDEYSVREGDTTRSIAIEFLHDPDDLGYVWQDAPGHNQLHVGDVVAVMNVGGQARLGIARRANDFDPLVDAERQYSTLLRHHSEQTQRLKLLKAQYHALTAAGRPVTLTPTVQVSPASASAGVSREELIAFRVYYEQEIERLKALENQLNALVDQRQAAIVSGDGAAAVRLGARYAELRPGYDREVVRMHALKRGYENLTLQDKFDQGPRGVSDRAALKRFHDTEAAKLQVLERRLLELASHRTGGDSEVDLEYKLVKKLYDDDTRRLNQIKASYTALADGQSSDGAVAASTAMAKAKPPSSVETMLQEEHAVFSRRLTLEPGITYNRFDRSQVVLSGFLALDAIFLGNIGIEGVESDTLRYDLTARYGLTDRLNVNLSVPYVQRSTRYEKGGAGGAGAIIGEATVDRDPTLGDVSVGVSYQVMSETVARPDLVASVTVNIPTGEHPYGVKTTTIATQSEENPMEVISELPTGSGIWSVNAGLSVVKSYDPAVLFANIGYTHTVPRGFDDISTTPGVTQPGEIDLGDSFQYGGGLAFALNERLSFSASYAHVLTRKSRIRPQGGAWQTILGSDLNAGSLNFGLTSALSEHWSLVTNVGAGLTRDASDLSFTVKFPYSM